MEELIVGNMKVVAPKAVTTKGYDKSTYQKNGYPSQSTLTEDNHFELCIHMDFHTFMSSVQAYP